MRKPFRRVRRRNKISRQVLTLSLVAAAILLVVVSTLASTKDDIEASAQYDSNVAYSANTDREMRGTWIASVNNINFPSKTGLSAAEMKAELDDIVKNCKEANLNAIFFQVRPTADALYDSSYFPTSKFLTGNQGDGFQNGFDPLEYIVQAAHENGIELHAWINPYRITTGSETNPSHDLNALAQNHPARRFPEYVVKYADGMMYFNPGIPAVQTLITSGVLEIVRKYNVDGIHFDDYFYPYPVNVVVDGKTVQAKYDDDETYKKYGADYETVEDFRRASVNTLMERVYKEIKKINPNIRFGISPFGIWANKSASMPTGSATAGLEAYKSLYCDAKAWIEGGYVDYICPQIYWAFTKKEAPFDVLVRWWSAVVDGTGVDLYIGHAVHKVTTEFKNETEIPQQVEFARSYMGVKGSVFYGYVNIAANAYNIRTNLGKMFASELAVSNPVSTGSGIIIGRPANEANISEANVNIMGGSDPAFPVYYNGEKLARTKSGYFSVYVPLSSGKNDIVFTQNNLGTTHVLYRGGKPASNTTYVYPQMGSYKIELLTTSIDIMKFPGEEIQVRVQAPSKSTVTAKLGGLTLDLTPLTIPPDDAAYMTEVYSGTIKLPDTKPEGTVIDLGNIVFTASRNNESASLTGPRVKLVNDTVYGTPCEVINDYSYFKIAPDSSFYDDYLPFSVGARDVIVGFKDNYFRLQSGGYVHHTNVKLLTGQKLAENKISSATVKNSGKTTDIIFGTSENVPVNAKCVDGVFTIVLFNTPSEGVAGITVDKNPIFSNAKAEYDADRKRAIYTLNLVNADNFYGFELSYESGNIILRVKNPVKKAEGDKPLSNLTIIVDAGHGGTDTGALGFLSTKGKNEKDLNLDIALVLRDKLTALGAKVVMIRTTDETIDIYSRMDTLNEVNPDLCISVHHNSLADTQNSTLTRGLLGLYCNDSGRLLTKSVSASTAAELNRFERSIRYQMLAMVRNHKFPATLVEMSFITNAAEYEAANTEINVQKSAEGIAKGVIAWLDNQEKFIIE